MYSIDVLLHTLYTIQYSLRTYAFVAPEQSVKLAKVLLKKVHSAADLTLCTSPQLAQELRDLDVPGVDVWRKGINTEIFSPIFKSQAMRERLSNGYPDAALLLYVGRLGKEKKVNRLKKVLNDNPGARLALVGSGPAEGELRELFKDYPNVYFVGPLTGVALSEAFASSDIFLMPSDSETLGFVVLEALASGIPVVGVAAGGLIDIIDHEKTGYLAVNGDDMTEFSAHTTTLIQNIELRKQIGQQAREYAVKWSWESATSILRNIQYQQAITNHRNSQYDKDEAQRILVQQGELYRPDLA